MKLAWSESDSGVDGVIGVLQNLGASTFLALLERSHLMSTLAGQGQCQPKHFKRTGNDYLKKKQKNNSNRAVDRFRSGQRCLAILAQRNIRFHHEGSGLVDRDPLLSHCADGHDSTAIR